MSPRTPTLSDRLRNYLLSVGLREHPALADLRRATDALPEGGMRSSAEQMQLLAFLIELMGARRVLEIGCFTGYGTLAMALALPGDGRIVTLDVNDHWAELGRRYWRVAGVAERIELRLGLAQESLDRLLAEGAAASFDLVYVDADKKLYDAYYERALVLARPGGVIALDNVLWHGAVADPDDRSRQAASLRALNAKIHADPRVSMIVLPIGDGLTLTRRR
ncbi:class I SAM-dependent methyltransferase [Benzoatithermus flavus]|uniref:Class I SAM-dependent methyltransferase n=1 Tax=Benzoatithermus flavus TaxID=3108223 RepID=A0ABU8XVV4_9PROT